jgi:hypothetical protein
MEIVEKVDRKDVELLGRLHQPVEHSVGLQLAAPGCPSHAQSFGQTGEDMPEECRRGMFAMKNRAIGFIDLSLARQTWSLPPGLATGMAVGADIAASKPAVIRAIRIGTALRWGVDRALAAPREAHDRGRRAGRLGVRIETVRTGFTQRLVDVSGERCGFFGALTSRFKGLNRRWRCGPDRVGPPDMDDQADQHEGSEEKLIE